MDRKSKAWLAVILVLCLGAVFAWLILESRSPQGQVAQIYLDQKLIEQVDLSQLKESRHLKVESPRGYNLIEFRPGSVAVIEADCPDQICVHQGAIAILDAPSSASLISLSYVSMRVLKTQRKEARKILTSSSNKHSTQRLTRVALLTAIALIIFVIEAQIPPLIPLPGVKLGLANIISLFSMFWLGRKEGFTVLILRILLGSIYTGSMLTMAYSLAGGLLSFAFVASFFKSFSPKAVWIPSILSGILHNVGQILCAIFITGSPEIVVYLPPLILTGSVTGLFTGLAAQLLLNHPYFKKS